MFSHRGGWDKNNEVVSHLSVAPQNWCSLNSRNFLGVVPVLKCSKTPFASFLNVLFTTCFAPDSRLYSLCCDVAQLDKMGEFWAVLMQLSTVFLASSESKQLSPENLEWHHLFKQSWQHFFFCIEQHLTVLVTSHWNHVAEAESEALSQNIGHVFVHNPPGDNPKFLTYDCKD